MADTKNSLLAAAPKWLGRYPMLDADHVNDLEMRAAAHQFGGKMERHKAEDAAHADYRKDQLHEAAAHHLVGMTAAHAAGDHDSAQKHGAMYQLALKALGHDSSIEPPEEVANKVKNTPSKVYRFKPHVGDSFSLPPKSDDEKAN
jgi:hypothetical protein